MSFVPPQILVIDDEPGVLDYLVEVLSTWGFAPIRCQSGREALAYLETGAVPALILLDLAMPEMSGQELSQRLQADSVWRTIPVVVVTGLDAVPDDLVHAGFLAKPISPGALFALITTYCGWHAEA